MNRVSDLRQIQAAVASMFWNKPAMRVVLAKHMFPEFLQRDEKRAARLNPNSEAELRWIVEQRFQPVHFDERLALMLTKAGTRIEQAGRAVPLCQCAIASESGLKAAAWRWCIADAGGDEGKARRLCQAEVHCG